MITFDLQAKIDNYFQIASIIKNKLQNASKNDVYITWIIHFDVNVQSRQPLIFWAINGY
jgi:hypothetical protein